MVKTTNLSWSIMECQNDPDDIHMVPEKILISTEQILQEGFRNFEKKACLMWILQRQ